MPLTLEILDEVIFVVVIFLGFDVDQLRFGLVHYCRPANKMACATGFWHKRLESR